MKKRILCFALTFSIALSLVTLPATAAEQDVLTAEEDIRVENVSDNEETTVEELQNQVDASSTGNESEILQVDDNTEISENSGNEPEKVDDQNILVSVSGEDSTDAAIILPDGYKSDYSGFVLIDKEWYYFNDGINDEHQTGFVDGTINKQSGKYYIEEGKLKTGPDVVPDDKSSNWKYIDETGKFINGYTGFAQNVNGWWYCKNGVVDFSVKDVIYDTVDGKTAWWNVWKNKVTAGPTVAKNSNGWWYINSNGYVDFTYYGFAENANGWWYCNKGKVNFSITDVINGTIDGKTAWWNVKKNKVTAGPTVAKNSNGWWYINNDGYVDFTYYGFAQNENGWWYCNKGKVNFSVTDVINGTIDGKKAWWNVKKNKVTAGPTASKNSNGWWYINNKGYVDFTYCGFVKNENGWWYCHNGRVDFSKGDKSSLDPSATPSQVKARATLTKTGPNLRAAFNYSAGLTYKNRSLRAPSGVSHVEYYANYGFTNKYGNCYVMAATFCRMARELGYECYLVEGWVPKRGGGVTAHGWTEIVINGTTYVCDPNFTNETGKNGYMINYGNSGTWRYQSYSRVK